MRAHGSTSKPLRTRRRRGVDRRRIRRGSRRLSTASVGRPKGRFGDRVSALSWSPLLLERPRCVRRTAVFRRQSALQMSGGRPQSSSCSSVSPHRCWRRLSLESPKAARTSEWADSDVFLKALVPGHVLWQCRAEDPLVELRPRHAGTIELCKEGDQSATKVSAR